MAKTLDANDKRGGVFIHSEDDSAPFVVGTLWLDETRGVMAEIPYISFASTQFKTPTRWFREQKPPANLLFRSEKLNMSLFRCRFSRITDGTYLAVGGLRVGDAVLHERETDIDEPLEISVFSSHIDGLADWTRLSSVNWDSEWIDDERGGRRRINYTVERQDGLTWFQGGARMTLTTHWGSDGDERESGVHLDDAVVLLSKFRSPRPIADHLAEHQKFRNLMSFVYGDGVYFRKHQLRDKSFPFQTLDGKTHGAENHQVLTSSTVADHYRPAPSKDAYNYPIITVKDVSPAILAKWAKEYDGWKRIVYPTAGVLQRSAMFAEDVVINASMSIEAIGQVLPFADGEETTYGKRSKKPTAATDFYRAMKSTCMDASPIAPSDSDLSWALANIYNTVKHADRGDFPDPMHTYFAGKITLLIVRLAVMKLLTPDGIAVKRFVESWGVGALFEHMRQASVSVNSSGAFVTSP